MRPENIKVGDRVVLIEGGAMNLVDILERTVEVTTMTKVTFTVKNLRQIRPHPRLGSIPVGTVYTIMYSEENMGYCPWEAATQEMLREHRGFQEMWLTPEA
jgi:hypothetical protein